MLIKKKPAKHKYYKSAIEENKNSKNIWKHIIEIGSKSEHSTPTMLTVNCQNVNDNSDIANIFNGYVINLSKTLLSYNAGYEETLTVLKDFTKEKLAPGIEFIIQPIGTATVYILVEVSI